MKLFPRSLFGSIVSAPSPRKEKDKDVGKDSAAPSAAAAGKDIPSPSPPGNGNDIPTPSIPGINNDIPTPSITDLDKDIPTPSAAGSAKDAPTPSPSDADSNPDKSVIPLTTTTTATVSITTTDTSTITEASATLTIIQHDLATVLSTAPTTITNPSPSHSLITISPPAATTLTLTTTILSTTSIATAPTHTHPTALLQPAIATNPAAKKHADAAVIVAVIFGLLTLGLVGVVCVLVLKLRRGAKARTDGGGKRFADEFEWPAVGKEEGGRKDEWGVKQKEAWGVV